MNAGLQFIEEWNVKHTSTPNFNNAIDWTLDKVCDWLRTNIHDFTFTDVDDFGNDCVFVDTNALCNNLKKQF